jgi:STE24 endopeptidase
VTQRPHRAVERRAAFVTVVISFALVAAVAALRVPWAWVPGGHLVPAAPDSLFTPAEIARSDAYAGPQRVLSWASYFLSLGFLVLVGLTPLGSRLLRRVTPSRRWWLAVPTGVLVVLVLEQLVALPFSVALHQRGLEFGLSRQGWLGWSEDQVKALVVDGVTTSVGLTLLVGLARRTARWWFAWAGGAAFVLTVAGSFLYPVVVEPLFSSFTPMAAGPVKQAVFRLADQEGVHIDDVLVADASRRTTTLNAYVSGFGRTRRVVVYDNLLHDLSPAQARVVIAHELGHAKYDDVVLGTALGAVGAVGGVALLALLLDTARLRRWSGTVGGSDPAAVASVLALVAVAGFVVAPAQNTVSRAIEARADRVSLETTHADATFVEMQRRLALTSLADPTPPSLSQFWWGSHPTVLQRAGLPQSLRAARR